MDLHEYRWQTEAAQMSDGAHSPQHELGARPANGEISSGIGNF